jgi:hypothetical protein
MLKPENLLEKNLEGLETNNYTIDECIEFANQQFNDLIVPVSKTSRGYKVALKKLADEVLSLRKQLKDMQSCKTKPEKASSTAASSQDSLALV